MMQTVFRLDGLNQQIIREIKQKNKRKQDFFYAHTYKWKTILVSEFITADVKRTECVSEISLKIDKISLPSFPSHSVIITGAPSRWPGITITEATSS